MKLSVLASGSSGNAIYIENNESKFLVDVGLTGKKTEELLKIIGRSPKDLTGIFISHEHRDHVSGAGILARKYKIPVYANAKTWEGMNKIVGEIPTELKFEFPTGTIQTFGGLDIESFGVSHDSREAMFFVFHQEGKKISLITDTGYVSDRMKGVISNSDTFVFECNHDVNMLRMGGYPWNLQQRILSDRGHVSNSDAAYAMSEAIGENTKRIYMAHLSRENNYKELARMTVEQILKQQNCSVGQQFFLYDTDPDKPTELVEV
jgi:phosphoribosyl 1,2-cyclic phosphodiesterase